jgi:cytochrome b
MTGSIIIVLMWVTLGFILAVAWVTNREKIMSKDNIMGRCPECGEAITARISEDHPHALADSVLAHVCPR